MIMIPVSSKFFFMFFELLFHFRHRAIQRRDNIGPGVGREEIIRVLSRSNDLDFWFVTVHQVGNDLNTRQPVKETRKLGNLVLNRFLSRLADFAMSGGEKNFHKSSVAEFLAA